MLGFELGEEFARRTESSFGYIVESLPDALVSVGLRSDVEKPLISGGVLDDRGGLSIDSEHDGSLRFFQLLQEVAGPPAECR